MFIQRFPIRLAVAGALVSFLSACAGEDAAPAASAPPALAVAAARLVSAPGYAQERAFTGRVEASRRSDVGFDQAGQLMAVDLDEGDRVAAGDVIARLDDARPNARLSEARAALAQSEADADLALLTRDRMATAIKSGAVTAADRDEAERGLKAARAAVEASRARVTSARVDVDKTRLLAPYDAIVTQRYVDEGQVLAAGQAIVALQEDVAPRIRIGIAGDMADSVSVGRGYRLVINNRPVDAVATAVLPLRDDVARTVDVLFDVNLDAARTLRPGDLARFTLNRQVESAGYWVPLDSLTEGRRGLWSNYVLVPADTNDTGATHAVEARAVDVLYQDAERAYVQGALTDGDLIVSGGLHRIVPGQGVRLGDQRTAATGQGR